MRKNVYWALMVTIATLLEASWPGILRVQGVTPDLILLMVVYFAIAGGSERAMITGLAGGLLQDVAGDTGLGHHVLSLVIVGYLAGSISLRLVTDSPAVKSGLVLAAGLLNGILFVAVSYLQDPGMNVLNTVAVSVVPRAFYTALVTPFVFYLLQRSRPQGQPVPGWQA